jgi:predicted DNA-binding transcriptional regulator AlpA
MAVAKNDDEYLTTVEFAALIKKTPNAVLLMRHRGTAPPAYEVNGRLLWKRSEIITWIESRREQSDETYFQCEVTIPPPRRSGGEVVVPIIKKSEQP